MNETDVTVAANPLTLGRVKAIARRQWYLVVLLALATALGAAEYVELRAPSYVSTVSMYTGIPPAGAGQSSGAVGFPDPVPDATSTQVVDIAAAAAGIPRSALSLSAVLNSDDTEIVIGATAPTPSEATQAVSAAEKAFMGTWAQQLNTLANSTAPQLAALGHQLQVLGTSPGRCGQGPGLAAAPLTPLSPPAAPSRRARWGLRSRS